MKILVAYRGTSYPGWATGDSLVRAFQALGHDAHPYGNYYRTDRWMGRGEAGADLLVYLECNDADPQYVELSKMDCRKVYWEFDTAMHEKDTVRLLDYMKFDQIYLANDSFTTSFDAQYLPYACDSDHFFPSFVDKFGAAIIGSPFPERLEFAKRVGVTLQSGKFTEDYAEAISGLKVGIHHHASGGAGLLVGRIWETLGCGTCLLTEDDPALRKHFFPEKHCVTYSTPEECRDNLAYLLTHDGYRESIANCGRAEVLSNHTYINRAEVILADHQRR